MTQTTFTLLELNAFDQEDFVAAVGCVFEHTPWIAREAWRVRPFPSREALYGALIAVLEAASDDQKLALIRAHPDLVGRAALAGRLGAESTNEQASVGLNR